MAKKDDAAVSKEGAAAATAAAARRGPNGVAARLAAPIAGGVRPVSAASLEVKSEQSEIHHYAQAVSPCVLYLDFIVRANELLLNTKLKRFSIQLYVQV